MSPLQEKRRLALKFLIYIFFRNGRCPIFNTHDTTYYPDRFADREIQELKVRCVKRKNGCEWSDCLRHLEVCFFLFKLFLFILLCCD